MAKAYDSQSTRDIDVQALLEENQRLRSEVEDYTSAVFAGLRENELSDASIRRDYAAIGDAIEMLMDRLLADVQDGSVKKHHRQIVRNDKQRELSTRTRFPEGLDLHKMADNDFSDYYFLSYILMSMLEEEIFSVPYPVGIPLKYRSFMRDFEQDMESPQKDPSVINNWRSDTVGHLITSPIFSPEQANALDSISTKAKKALISWLPQHLHRALTAQESLLRGQIIKPAVTLHHAIRSSIDRYQFTKAPVQREPQRYQGSPYTLKDIGSWRVVGAGDISTALSTLNLGIDRLDPGKPSVHVVQPVLLVSISQKTGVKTAAHTKVEDRRV